MKLTFALIYSEFSLFHITIANLNPVECSGALLANQRREKGKVFDKSREVDLSVDSYESIRKNSKSLNAEFQCCPKLK